MYVFSGGGYGGSALDDGLTNGCSTIGISKTQPVEVLEQHYPILFEQYSLREHSGGAGRTRGGFGVDYKVRIRRGEALLSFLMDHGRFGPPGLFGGQHGATNEVVVERQGVDLPLPPLVQGRGHPRRPGDAVHVRRPAVEASATRSRATRSWCGAMWRVGTSRRRTPRATTAWCSLPARRPRWTSRQPSGSGARTGARRPPSDVRSPRSSAQGSRHRLALTSLLVPYKVRQPSSQLPGKHAEE